MHKLRKAVEELAPHIGFGSSLAPGNSLQLHLTIGKEQINVSPVVFSYFVKLFEAAELPKVTRIKDCGAGYWECFIDDREGLVVHRHPNGLRYGTGNTIADALNNLKHIVVSDRNMTTKEMIHAMSEHFDFSQVAFLVTGDATCSSQ